VKLLGLAEVLGGVGLVAPGLTGMSFLLTWNCAHIANATMRERIEAVCRREGFNPPVICTPEELTYQEDS
jgi:hypothetical protein